MHLNPDDAEQMSEIGDIGWFTCDEALKLFRPYDVEKKSLLIELDEMLSCTTFAEETTENSEDVPLTDVTRRCNTKNRASIEERPESLVSHGVAHSCTTKYL